MWVPKVRNIFIGLCAQGQTDLGSAVLPWLRHSFIELCSISAIVIHMLFSSWCWGSSGGRVRDGFSMFLIMVHHLVSVLAYCRLPLPLAMPVEHCAHSKFPSGSTIRVLRFWSRNTATPISPGFTSAIFSYPLQSSQCDHVFFPQCAYAT